MKILSVLILSFLSISVVGQSVGYQNGLVAYYPVFDKKTVDYSGNGNDAQIAGNTDFIKDRFGNKNGAVYFDGKDADLFSQNSPSINTLSQKNAFCISLWFYVEDWSEDIFPIVNKSEAFSGYGFTLYANATSLVIKDRKDELTFNFNINKKTWYHLVCNYAQQNASQMVWGLYLNNLGIMTPRNFVQAIETDASELYFGKTKFLVNAMPQTIRANGAMDEIRVYNRILSDSEIAGLFSMEDRSAAFESNKIKFPVVQIASNSPSNPQNTIDSPATPIIRSTEESEKPVPSNPVVGPGKYYALIIGNNDYTDPDIISLDKPISDAQMLYEALMTNYTFDNQNVYFLKNASYEQTIEELDHLASVVTPQDNFLMFYAGHGYWDEDKSLGYWLPIDAKKRNKAQWLANSRIKDYLHSIESKHTLLIADACFGGSIFKTRAAFANASMAINKLYEIPSRKAMTSGNVEPVPDGSMFIKYLVKKLTDNTEDYLSSDDLFQQLRPAVTNNSATTPQYGVIQDVGDEGGEFIFIRKNQ